MGIGPFRSSREEFEGMGSGASPEVKYVYITEPAGFTGNPNPLNYRVIRSEQAGSALVVEIKYPDCTNFEGRKILVFANFDIERLLSQKVIDPHFFKSTDKRRAPVARFEPTDQGWKHAIRFAKTL